MEVRQSHSSEEAPEQAELALRAQGVERRGLTQKKRFQQENSRDTEHESKKPSGRPSLLTEQQKQTLVDYIEQQSQSSKGGRLNGEMIQCYIKQTFAVNYHQNSILYLMKSLNISWTTRRSKHPKQSQEAQDAFKKNCQFETSKLIPSHITIDKVDFWFQDEDTSCLIFASLLYP